MGRQHFLLGSQLGNVLIAWSFAAIAYRLRFRQFLALRSIHPLHVLLVLLIIVPEYYVLVVVHTLVQPLLPSLGVLEELGKMVEAIPWFVTLIAVSFCPGIAEEVFCRGFLGRGLVARHGVWLGVALSALLFGAIHIEPAQAVYAVVMGVSLHIVYLSTKSLSAAILLHAANNAFVLVLGLILGNGTDAAAENGPQTPEGASILLVLTALAACVAILVLFVKSRVRWLSPDGSAWTPGYATAEMPPAELGLRPRLTRPPLWVIGVAVICYLAFAGVLAWELVKPTG